jgi:hypothetical protein
VGGIKLLNHLDTCAAVLCNLVNVSTFKKPKADIAVAKAIGGAPVAFAVEFETLFVENRIEEIPMRCGDYEIRR